MRNPTISIILPVYNAKKYLKKCVKSILNQTFEDFELLVIDDGSTDGSGEICDKFALLDGRIRVFHQANKGLPNARNIGLKEAKGEWIGFVDNDDFCESKMFEVLLKNAIEKKVNFCVCGFNEVQKDGVSTNGLLNLKSGFMSSYEVLDIWIMKHCFIMCWNILIKREILTKNKIDFDEKYKLHEDTLFIYKLLKCVDRIYICTDLLYNYIRRENSLSTYVNIDDKKLKAIELFNEMISMEKNEKIKTDIKIMKLYRLLFYAQTCIMHDQNNPHYNRILKHLKGEFSFAFKCKNVTFKNRVLLAFTFFPKIFLIILKVKAFFRKLS